jgi:hypothetical protein
MGKPETTEKVKKFLAQERLTNPLSAGTEKPKCEPEVQIRGLQ